MRPCAWHAAVAKAQKRRPEGRRKVSPSPDFQAGPERKYSDATLESHMVYRILLCTVLVAVALLAAMTPPTVGQPQYPVVAFCCDDPPPIECPPLPKEYCENPPPPGPPSFRR